MQAASYSGKKVKSVGKIKKGNIAVYYYMEGKEKMYVHSETVFTTNEDFDKIIVEGEGGLQEKKSQKLIRDAYKLVGKEIIIDIYKKTWVDGEMKDEEINERKKTKSSYRSSFRE